MKDCLSSLNSTAYDCTTFVFQNCINELGFDFASLWNITQIIQQNCPTDPRLFLINDAPATSQNAALNYKACKTFVPKAWTIYPTSDIWARLQTWKFPLFQLALSTLRPPLGLWIDGFVLAHLMGDPISTIKDLQEKLSRCEDHAVYFKKRNVKSKSRGCLSDREWKALAMICVAYDEWGEGYAAQEALGKQL
jgi:hypothetical protein